MTAWVKVLLLAAAMALSAWGGHEFRDRAADAERAELVSEMTRERLQAEASARSEEAAVRVRQQRILDDEFVARTTAESHARAADAAAGRLRRAVNALAARCSPPSAAAPASGPPADSPGDLLADLHGRLDALAGDFAAEADRYRRAGHACERTYDALSPPSDAPRP